MHLRLMIIMCHVLPVHFVPWFYSPGDLHGGFRFMTQEPHSSHILSYILCTSFITSILSLYDIQQSHLRKKIHRLFPAPRTFLTLQPTTNLHAHHGGLPTRNRQAIPARHPASQVPLPFILHARLLRHHRRKHAPLQRTTPTRVFQHCFVTTTSAASHTGAPKSRRSPAELRHAREDADPAAEVFWAGIRWREGATGG